MLTEDMNIANGKTRLDMLDPLHDTELAQNTSLEIEKYLYRNLYYEKYCITTLPLTSAQKAGVRSSAHWQTII